ncbi:hypothetical protein NDU88_004477 [Pleurodeles waltl]|uniref:Uncharacterized protein n=1 Tax=Pleurodeles waltl TaxID=8319 RepID=A0AAV7WYE0_PLEWA|nr:hypothetical protein NDU88_004477 [Pleurodeles waltl]
MDMRKNKKQYATAGRNGEKGPSGLIRLHRGSLSRRGAAELVLFFPAQLARRSRSSLGVRLVRRQSRGLGWGGTPNGEGRRGPRTTVGPRGCRGGQRCAEMGLLRADHQN